MYARSMIALIRDLPLPELLGIDDLPKEDLDSVMGEFGEILVELLLNRLEENPLWSDEQKKDASDFINANIGKDNFFDLLKQKYPDLDSMFDSETYMFKKNVLLEQIEQDKDFEFDNLTEEDKSDWLDILNNLKDVIEKDNEYEFEVSWMEYLDFKSNK